jgi:predicted acylesterase/phospholipase RssA
MPSSSRLRRARRPLALRALLCGSLASSLVGSGHAQVVAPTAVPAVASSSAGPRPLSFTVSGGVSLGAYEAGALHFLTEAIKRSEGQVELRIATGASAGGANALISLMDSCRPTEDDPARSLGFETWLPVGMGQLFQPERVTATSVLTRAPLERAMARLARHFRAGLRADCDVVLGVSVTREIAAHAELSNRATGTALEIPRQIERFVVRIRGRGPGRVPRLENYVDPRARLSQPLLPFETGDDDRAQARNFARLTELLYASAAFPLAFAAYPLALCETDPSSAATPGGPVSLACDEPVRTRFIDGGVFDNSPLRLNYNVVQRALRVAADGRARWLELGEDAGGQVPDVRFSYVDPGTRAFPSLDVDGEGSDVDDDGDDAEQRPRSARELALRLISTFIDTARRHELLLLLEESDDAAALGDRIGLTHNQLPTISSQLGAFFGFFERDFRKLDFYLGMYDGLISVRSYLASTGASAERTTARLAEQFPVLRVPLARGLPAAMRPFACLLSQVEARYAGHASACAGKEDRNFRILLQVTLDRLHTACARAQPHELPSHVSPSCLQAARGGPRWQVPGVAALTPARRAPLEREPEFAYTLRLLADYGFAYHDLGLEPDEAEYGAVKIRRSLLAMASKLAQLQPSGVDELMIVTAARAGVNQIAYEPPKNWLYASAGTAIEVGASLLPFSWNQSWARLNLALQISNWETLATPKRLTLAFSPLAGPELQLLFLSNPTVQTMLGGRVGYQASVTDGAGFEPCHSEAALGDARNCSQLVLQGYLAAAIIERLRVQLVVESFPTEQDTGFESRIGFQLTFGLQLF